MLEKIIAIISILLIAGAVSSLSACSNWTVEVKEPEENPSILEPDIDESLPEEIIIDESEKFNPANYEEIPADEAEGYYEQYIAPIGDGAFLSSFEKGNMPERDSYALWVAFETLVSDMSEDYISDHINNFDGYEGDYLDRDIIEMRLLSVFDLDAEDIRSNLRGYVPELEAYEVPAGLGGYMPKMRVAGKRPIGNGAEGQLLIAYYGDPDCSTEDYGVLTVRRDDLGKVRYISYEMKTE